MDLNQAPNEGFFYFVKFELYVSPKIACNDSLWQCLTCSRGKTLEKNFGDPNLDQMSQHQSQNCLTAR